MHKTLALKKVPEVAYVLSFNPGGRWGSKLSYFRSTGRSFQDTCTEIAISEQTKPIHWQNIQKLHIYILPQRSKLDLFFLYEQRNRFNRKMF